MEIINYIVNFFSHNILENISLFSGIAFVFLIIKEKRIGWVFYFISAVIMIYLYVISKVYMQVILSIIYTGIAIYGFFTWTSNTENLDNNLKVTEYSQKNHIVIIVVASIASWLISYLVHRFTSGVYTVMDAFIFSFSLVGTFLQVKKILSSWYYWIVIDSVCIILNFKVHYYSLSTLHFLFVLISIYGCYTWSKSRKNNITV